MDELDALLALQDSDTRIDDLLERRAHLPELDRLRAAHEAEQALGRQLARLDGESRELALGVDKLDGEIQLLDTKVATEDRRLYGGTVKSKELEALMHAIETMRKRKGAMEDELLERMETRDSLLTRIGGVRDELGTAQARKAEAETAVGALWSEIDAEVGALRARREGLVSQVGPELRALYERIRAQRGGTAAARIDEHGLCSCPLHLRIPQAEGEKIRRSPTHWARCESCERILVATPLAR